MNQRERWVETLTFGAPDRIPLKPGWPRESTRERWHKEGLPEDAAYPAYLYDTIGIERDPPTQPRANPGVDFRMIPQFEEKIIGHEDDHYIVQDWKGNICEISDQYDTSYLKHAKDFVTRKWISCPVENRGDWEEMKERYSVDSPGRFPDDFEERCAKLRKRDYFVMISYPGPFWQLREWCGFEGLCMMMVDSPDLVKEMAEFWNTFIGEVLDRIFDHFTPDAVRFQEDMAYKQKPMIGPEMVRRYCQPCWTGWAEKARNAGVPIIGIDSDGYVGELIPLWLESGLNYCDPLEVAAGCDINQFRREFGHEIAFAGGVDKRCIASGGETIRSELDRIEPVVRDGGYVPGCDHGVPSDVSWDSFVEYTRLLARMTGWL